MNRKANQLREISVKMRSYRYRTQAAAEAEFGYPTP
jgi:hypothetical protein